MQMWTPVKRLDQEMSSESRRETSQGGSQASFEEQEPEPESALTNRMKSAAFLFQPLNLVKIGGLVVAHEADILLLYLDFG